VAGPIDQVPQRKYVIGGAAASNETRLALGAQALRGGNSVQPRAE
jgi:hypothetical protein